MQSPPGPDRPPHEPTRLREATNDGCRAVLLLGDGPPVILTIVSSIEGNGWAEKLLLELAERHGARFAITTPSPDGEGFFAAMAARHGLSFVPVTAGPERARTPDTKVSGVLGYGQAAAGR